MFNLKKILGLLLLYSVVNACSSEVNNKDKSNVISIDVKTDSMEFDRFVINYIPHNIDMSKDLNDTLSHYNIDEIFSNVSEQAKNRWVYILMLKQYLHHLKVGNQGYDLYTMRKGKTGIIINYYIRSSNQKPNGEFLNSGSIVDATALKKHLSNDPIIIELMNKIRVENKRIME
ncbi:MAG: hypothetical protein K1X81_01605 [Bacteroidia bacterium]|nr:hypothetical protein [Bacteroidia bacterium]